MLSPNGTRLAAASASLRRCRTFSTTHARAMTKLRIGYVPEHFSTPLFFAQKHYGLDAELVPFPTGTGALSSALKEKRGGAAAAGTTTGAPGPIDVAIGLTEGFVADLGRAKASAAGAPPGYGLVGTYVESPLRWAISTGAARSELAGVGDLRGARAGVSRVGSGSYVMAFVLADGQGWLAEKEEEGGEDQQQQPFSAVLPIGDFAALRAAVGPARAADFFMWEHFTTKHYWDAGELKRLGDIYTPWPSWVVAARDDVRAEAVPALADTLNAGVRHYRAHKDEAIEHITTTMRYSRADTEAWMETVRFADDVRGVSADMVDRTVGVLRKAGVLGAEAGGSEHMVTVAREE